MSFGPRRIVCLTEEPTEVLYALGEQDRIVGISGFTVRPPRARKEKPKVSAFTSAKVGEILKLRQIDIDHPEWQKAMAAVTASMHVSASVVYVRFYRRDDTTGRYEPISLDAASV